MNGYLQDLHGNKSSKRWWGRNLLTIGCLMAISLFIGNLLAPLIFNKAIPMQIHNNCYDIAQFFFYTGGALLGFGVMEGWGKK
jgi:hypothetical protein